MTHSQPDAALAKKRYDNTVYAKRWREKNPEKARAATARWQAKNRDYVRKYRKGLHLTKLYGLTLEQFQKMLIMQMNCCGVCREKLIDKPRNIHVDHCHQTGRVRAILCNNCNNMIGRARDNPGILRKAADYLDRFSVR